MAMPIKWGRSDPFTHMLITGATRSGKTATILKPMIYQILLAKKRGIEVGLSVVEPKGDVARMVAEMAEEMELDYLHVDPTIPNSAKFNPMEGEINDVAEATVIVLKGLFGKQDAFFATVQELSARNVTKLLKELRGDDLDIVDVMNTLRDPNELRANVEALKRKKGHTDLVHFFESELLGSMADRYRQFVIGLRAQLENIVSNDSLRKIMTDRSDINIDKHFAEGGILAVNTALGMLRSSGDAFGQFIIMHLQNGTFRRPGTENTRIPHFMIVDEYSRYINPDVEIFLALAAEYRVAGIFAIQSLGQLEIEAGKVGARAMKRSILTNCRNKIVFGGVGMEDAKEFAEMFGKDKIIMRQSTYKNRIMLPVLFPDSYRDTETEEYRFDATDILDGLPRFTYVHQLVKNGALQEPGLGLGTFVPRNWKEMREWEQSDKKQGLLSRARKLFVPEKRTKDKKSNIAIDLSKEELEEMEKEADMEEVNLFKNREIQAEEDARKKIEMEKLIEKELAKTTEESKEDEHSPDQWKDEMLEKEINHNASNNQGQAGKRAEEGDKRREVLDKRDIQGGVVRKGDLNEMDMNRSNDKESKEKTEPDTKVRIGEFKNFDDFF